MLITSAVILAVLIAADLLTKAFTYTAVEKAGGSMQFIPHIIRFESTRNTGMAWGMFSNATLLLTIFTFIACGLIVFFIIKKIKVMPLAVRLGLLMILAGALGNLYDRVFLGYVRDFIAFDFMEFPIFNFADSCVTIGAIVLGAALILTRSGRQFFASLDGSDKAKSEDEKRTGDDPQKEAKTTEEAKTEPADD